MTKQSSGTPGTWRKREGVEPTKDRLAAPPGFEVRTPHRGRFSSMTCCRSRLVGRAAVEIEAVPVQAAQVAAPQRHPVTIEELQDLDRDLASIVEAVAQLRSGELAFLGMRRDVGDDLHHL